MSDGSLDSIGSGSFGLIYRLRNIGSRVGARDLWLRWRWVFVPLAVFAVTRVFSTAWLMIGAQQQVALVDTSWAYRVTVPTEASPGYFGVVSNWDGQWFRSIAESGYPISLPTEQGRVVQNEWAFLPAYPMLVRAVMWLSHTSFPISATIVSLACSATAMVILYRMVVNTGDEIAAFTVVLGLCVFPASPILQVGYSESLALLLVVLALVLLGKRKYGWLVPVAVGLSLTRQIVLALAVVIGLHWLSRWRRVSVEPFPMSERFVVGALVVLAACLSGLWPLIAGIVTGYPAAYVESHAAWLPGHRPGLGENWLGVSFSNLGLAAIVLPIIVYAVLISVRRESRAWGTELRSWSIVYPAYVLAATRPSLGLLRHLLISIGLLWPLAEVAPRQGAAVPSRRPRLALALTFAAVCILGQYFWVTRVFTIGPGTQPFP